MANETRACERCGKVVTRYRKPGAQHAFWTCSRSCAGYLNQARGGLGQSSQANRFRGQRESRPCAACGRPTKLRYVTEANHNQPWYCSRACGRPTSLTAHVRTGSDVPCATCGTPFYRTPGRKIPRKYCSRACADASKQRARIERACIVCGAQMQLLPCYRHKQYCSPGCRYIGRYKNAPVRLHNGRGVRVDHLGYVLVWQPGHPNAKPNGWILEHRLVMSQQLGRPLRSDEDVHHRNGNRADNAPENLEVLTRSEHRRETGKQQRRAKERLYQRLTDAEAQVEALRTQLAALNGAADDPAPPRPRPQ